MRALVGCHHERALNAAWGYERDNLLFFFAVNPKLCRKITKIIFWPMHTGMVIFVALLCLSVEVYS